MSHRLQLTAIAVPAAAILLLAAACQNPASPPSPEMRTSAGAGAQSSADDPHSHHASALPPNADEAASPSSPRSPGPEVRSATATEDLLKAVRRTTSRFHSTNQALRAGYEPDEHCVDAPGLGGMGYHWVNESLVDPVFEPLRPEVVLYATGPGGNLQLVAVEYIVIDIGQDPPMFGDQPFDVGGTPVPVPHWSLHVWLYEDNPSGMFAPFNPNVRCP